MSDMSDTSPRDARPVLEPATGVRRMTSCNTRTCVAC
jgi:hypothetical protein